MNVKCGVDNLNTVPKHVLGKELIFQFACFAKVFPRHLLTQSVCKRLNVNFIKPVLFKSEFVL